MADQKSTDAEVERHVDNDRRSWKVEMKEALSVISAGLVAVAITGAVVVKEVDLFTRGKSGWALALVGAYVAIVITAYALTNRHRPRDKR